MLDVDSLDAVERNAPDHKAADAMDRVLNQTAVRQALDTLEHKEELVIRALYGIGEITLDVTEVVREYQIPRSTVYALHNNALAKLRRVLTTTDRVMA